MSDAKSFRTPMRLALSAAATSGLLWACTTATPTGTAASATSAQAHASLGSSASAETTTAAADSGAAANSGAAASGSGMAGASAGAAAGAGSGAAAGASGAATDMAHAKTTFQTVCSGCHEASLATDLRNTRRGWEQVVDRMFGFGMSASDAQVKEIVDYLATTYPAQ